MMFRKVSQRMRNTDLALSPYPSRAAARTLSRDAIIPAHTRYDRGDFFWLCYLVFFFIEPVTRNNPTYWMKSLTAFGFFMLFYLAALRFVNLRLRVALLAGMSILGAACFSWNGGGPTFTIYSAALLPFFTSCLPLILSWFVVSSGMLALVGWRFHISPYGWLSDILLVFMVGGANVFFAQKQRADFKLRMKQEEIEALAAVAERERIARDLHDVLGHTLSLIVLKSELAGRLIERELTGHATIEASSQPELPNAVPPQPELSTAVSSRPELSTAVSSRPELSKDVSPQPELSKDVSSRPERDGLIVPRSGETPVFAPAHLHESKPQRNRTDLPTLLRARTEIAEVERTARTALAEVREAIGGYRARGLAAELEAARQALSTAGVALTTEGDLQPATLTAAEETVLALALREAVTNIVRHAQATHCRLRLVVEHGQHRLSVQDNGRHPELREGNGLRGMRERVESLGGQLSLTREDGTHLLIELPLHAHPAT